MLLTHILFWGTCERKQKRMELKSVTIDQIEVDKDFILNHVENDILKLWHEQSREPLTEEEWAECLIVKTTKEEKHKNQKVLENFIKKARNGKFDFQYLLDNEQFVLLEKYMGSELFAQYITSMCQFFRGVRTFDPSITAPWVWQALRNYLIYGTIVGMEAGEQGCHDAIMGYSLLYPYTDNYIDNPDISNSDKIEFNQMIEDTLKGKEIKPTDPLQDKIIKCLLMGMNYREGSKKEASSALLLLMLDAQAYSTRFMGYSKEDYRTKKDDIIRMLGYKGGVSVLNDYFFSIPKIDLNGIIFYLQFGFILQLADDIQDIPGDIASKTPTLYSMVDSVKEREANFYQLIRFIRAAFQGYEAKNEQMRLFMLRSTMLLCMLTIIRSEDEFSDEFNHYMDDYIPFARDFSNQIDASININDKMSKLEQERLFTIIGAMCKEVL